MAVRRRARIADAWRKIPVVQLLTAKRGAVGVEYALLMAFMAIVAAGGLMMLGDGLSRYFVAASHPVGASAVSMPNPLGGGGGFAGGGSTGGGSTGGGSTGGGSTGGGSTGGGSTGGGSTGGGNGGGNGGGKVK